MTKTIQGWDRFVADAQREPVLVPLWEGQTVTVNYPSKKKLRQIFDDHANLLLYPEVGADGRETNPGAIVTLFGEAAGRRLIEESEDLDGVDRPLEHMTCRVLVELGLLKAHVLDQFKQDAEGDEAGEEGGDPNPTSSSSSSTGTAGTSNGTSPSGTSISLTSSAA